MDKACSSWDVFFGNSPCKLWKYIVRRAGAIVVVLHPLLDFLHLTCCHFLYLSLRPVGLLLTSVTFVLLHHG